MGATARPGSAGPTRRGLAPLAWWRARSARVLPLWGVGIAASLVVTALSALGYLEPLQARSLDLLLRLQEQRQAPEVVIVAIDEDAFESVGRRQPIPRDYLARLIRGIQRAGAAVVGLDVALNTATVPEEDGALVEAILGFGEGETSRVVLVDSGVPRGGPLAAPEFRAGAMRAAAEVPLDRDGVIRRVSLLVPRGPDRFEPAFPLAVAARLGGLGSSTLRERLPTGGGLVPLPLFRPGLGWAPAGQAPLWVRPGEILRINYLGGPGSFLTIPSNAVAALADPAVPIARDNPLAGRVVMVGGTFADSRDFFHTPHGLLAGVEVHANIVHMLLTRSAVQPSGWAASLGVQVGIVLVAGLVMSLMRPLTGTLLSLVVAVLVGVPASAWAFQRSGYWVDFLLPVLVTCVLGLGAELLARRRIRDSFSRYLSREVASQVLADVPGLRGEHREVSILFSDLRGFTTLSEGRDAEEVAAKLTEYFDAMTEAIFAHRGMINDFIGDGIMAIFGAPVPDPDHALHAVRSAWAMDRALARLNERWGAAGLPTLRMGIGVHTGEVFAGNVGGAARVKYTLVGDPVNLASRVEGLNKELGTTILITEETHALVASRVSVKDLGAHAVKGRVQPVRVFELLGVDEGRPD